MIVPLLLIATFDSPKHALHNNTMTESNKKMYKIWYNHSRCRIVQAGQLFSIIFILLVYFSENLLQPDFL